MPVRRCTASETRSCGSSPRCGEASRIWGGASPLRSRVSGGRLARRPPLRAYATPISELVGTPLCRTQLCTNDRHHRIKDPPRSRCRRHVGWTSRQTELDGLLRRINTYLVRGARRKFTRLKSFKKAKRWWNGLLLRQPALFAHWAWMTEF
jgi:hypothetical protein